MKHFNQNPSLITAVQGAIISVAASIALFSSHANAQTQAVSQFTDNVVEHVVEKAYSSKGYPYKNLIHRSKTIKIFYRQEQANIHCRVEVALNDSTVTASTVREIDQQAFADTPLSSCLPRDQAKRLLAQTF